MSKSRIEWTEATWNPVVGCSKVSPGCKNCYAEKMTKRLQAMGQEKYSGLINDNGNWAKDEDGKAIVRLHEPALLLPLKTKRPTMWFVNSMSDLFHEELEDKQIAAVFAAMAMCHVHTGKMRENADGSADAVMQQRHIFQVLTKRPARLLDFMTRLVAGVTGKTEALMSDLDGVAAKIWNPDANVVREKFETPDLVRWFDHCCVYFSAQLGHWLPQNASLTGHRWVTDGMPGLWLGVSCENQATADERIPLLLQTPAAVRFLSCEPLLGKVDILSAMTAGASDGVAAVVSAHGIGTGIDWMIAGGESGAKWKARPCHPAWVRFLRDQCANARVPFFFKQWGAFWPFVDPDKFTHCGEETKKCEQHYVNPDGSWGSIWIVDDDGVVSNFSGELKDDFAVVNHVGKDKSGRELDFRTHEEFPAALKQWPGFKRFTTKNTKGKKTEPRIDTDQKSMR